MSESKRHRWGPRRERAVPWQDGTVGAYVCGRCGCVRSSELDRSPAASQWARFTTYTLPSGEVYMKAPPCVPKDVTL